MSPQRANPDVPEFHRPGTCGAAGLQTDRAVAKLVVAQEDQKIKRNWDQASD
jgi:hypothetical protein